MKSTTVNLDADKARGSRRDRLPWLDYAKGIGIILVVVGHTLRGLMNAAVITETLPYEIADRWIYAFHMPLFFFLSGLLLPKSFAKNLTTVLGKKAKTILYPFLLWSFIQGAIQLALSNYTNGDFTGR
ncbi:MAG TPA: acyltransferase family protein, partial [Candidatus Obscuribacterales bacterium]